MSFGIYVHIPYCIQRCPYCDFATYERNSILPQEDYVQLVLREIEMQSPPPQKLESLYFGGGTPSLLKTTHILALIERIAKAGFAIDSSTEITIEINPGTVGRAHLLELLDIGVNRFSVGAQTFHQDLIKGIGREHTVKDTTDLLELLAEKNVNYSLDVLYAIPDQTPQLLELDLQTALSFSPPHVSPYCLTVPETNPLAKIQPTTEIQAEMFEQVHKTLTGFGYRGYEISNYCKEQQVSRHNMLYWTDQNYWGIGLSSHSFLHTEAGETRFWNPRSINDYVKWVKELVPSKGQPWLNLPTKNFEQLNPNESLSDYCHTAMRLDRGIEFEKLATKYGNPVCEVVKKRLKEDRFAPLLNWAPESVSLNLEGRMKSNKVFETLYFSADEIAEIGLPQN